MSVLYPLIQALVLFAVAPLLSGITRVARARLHNRRGPGVLQEYRDIFKLLGRQSVGPDASGGTATHYLRTASPAPATPDSAIC
ncbi:NADH-quinone oxidoreductase subunit H, partial [Escherichia sp. R-CC3]